MAEKKSYLEVVAGRDIRASDDHHEVIEQLADILDRLIDGDLQGVDRFLITLVDNEGGGFWQAVSYHATAIEALAYLKTAEAAVLDEILR